MDSFYFSFPVYVVPLTGGNNTSTCRHDTLFCYHFGVPNRPRKWGEGLSFKGVYFRCFPRFVDPTRCEAYRFRVLRREHRTRRALCASVQRRSHLHYDFIRAFQQRTMLTYFSKGVGFRGRVLRFTNLPYPFVCLFRSFRKVCKLSRVDHHRYLFRFVFLGVSLRIPSGERFRATPFIFRFLRAIFSRLFRTGSRGLLRVFR